MSSVVSTITDVTGATVLGMPPLVASRNVFGRLTGALRQWEGADNFLDAIEHDLGGTTDLGEDLDFLSKVNTVAALRRPRVS